MTPSQDPQRFQEIISKAEAKISKVEEKVEEGPKTPSLWRRTLAVMRNRIITGILFVTPIVVTIWFVHFFLNTIYVRLEPSLQPFLKTWWGMQPGNAAYKGVGIALSVLVVLAVLYLVGLISARRTVRRLINMAERIVVRIPFVKFFYGTSKKILDTIAVSSSGALKKVVVIEYPRPGIRTIAFVTGSTRVSGYPTPLVNLFVPTTPNPTSGYMVMLSPDEVFETDLTIEQAMSFVVSGGILPPERLHLRPFDLSFVQSPAKRESEAYETSMVE